MNLEEIKEVSRLLMRANEANPDPNTSQAVAISILREGWGAKEVLKSLLWLRRENLNRGHIYGAAAIAASTARPCGFRRILEFDSFDFIERNLIFGPIVEPAGAVEMLVTMMGLTPLSRISRASGRR
jgi:hypothetical protein